MSAGDSEWRVGFGIGQAQRFQPGKQRAVQFLGQVVAALVGRVHAALYRGQFGVGRAGSAGLVFDVPEVEVGAMLAGDPIEPITFRFLAGMRARGRGDNGGHRGLVPGVSLPVVQVYDCVC